MSTTCTDLVIDDSPIRCTPCDTPAAIRNAGLEPHPIHDRKSPPSGSDDRIADLPAIAIAPRRRPA